MVKSALFANFYSDQHVFDTNENEDLIQKHFLQKGRKRLIVRITVAPVCGVTRFIPAAGSIEIVIRYHIVGGAIPVLHQLVDI